MGDLPRVELFARQSTPGWDVWGNEVASTVPGFMNPAGTENKKAARQTGKKQAYKRTKKNFMRRNLDGRPQGKENGCVRGR